VEFSKQELDAGKYFENLEDIAKVPFQRLLFKTLLDLVLLNEGNWKCFGKKYGSQVYVVDRISCQSL
jgi:hypothetical protein